MLIKVVGSQPDGVGPDRRRSHDRRSRDRGFTFIETVVTVMLIAIVMVPVLEAVRSAVRASSRSHSASQIETVIINVADRVNRAPSQCDYTNYARAAVLTQGWYTGPGQYNQAATVSHEWYDTATKTWMSKPAGSAAPGCPGSGLVEADLLVQRVTISVTNPDGQSSRTIQVVKSDV
jgi:prepilin-type N-terminal cleavage/methylation domain-containing protein